MSTGIQHRILLIGLFFLSGPSISGQNTWERKADLPDRRGDAVAFSLGGYGYLGTGVSSGNDNEFFRYDPESDKWERYSLMPGLPRMEAFCFVIKDKVYIGGGVNSTNTYDDELWEFDPVENTWNQKNNLPFYYHNSYITVSFSINDKGYLKRDEFDDFGSLVEYDPIKDEWKRLADFPGVGLLGQVGFSLLGKGYVGLGFDGRNKTSEFWEYDPALNRWERKANFPGYLRTEALSFTIGRSGYVGSGRNRDYGGMLNDFWIYSPDTGSWSRIADCPYKSINGCAFSINGKGYFGTGFYSEGNEIWEYSPTITSIPDVENSSLIHLYPNPAHDHVYVKSSLPQVNELMVYSITGAFAGSLAVKENRIDLKGLEPGLYYLVVDSGRMSAGNILVVF